MENLKQGEIDWLGWRKNGIGSSDAPIIMKVSPYKTPYQLWEEKISDVLDEEKSWAMIRGNDLEPIARSQYEILENIDMPPALAVHPQYDFLRASLDGYNKELSRILEIKCPGKEDHSLAKNKIIPQKYYPQLQHQLMVTGAEVVHYYSFDGVSGFLIEVERNEAYIEELMKKEIEFWDLVNGKIPPPYTDHDFVPIEDGALLSHLALWKKQKEEMERLSESNELLRRTIEGCLSHVRSKGAGVKILKILRKGNVDYSKIPELKNIDLEKYRKEGSEFFSFAIEKQ